MSHQSRWNDPYAGMSHARANREIDRIFGQHPDAADAIVAAVEMASPLAGPVRILRELAAAIEPDTDLGRYAVCSSPDPRDEPEWCLHCGSDECVHAARHNAAIGRSA